MTENCYKNKTLIMGVQFGLPTVQCSVDYTLSFQVKCIAILLTGRMG